MQDGHSGSIKKEKKNEGLGRSSKGQRKARKRDGRELQWRFELKWEEEELQYWESCVWKVISKHKIPKQEIREALGDRFEIEEFSEEFGRRIKSKVKKMWEKQGLSGTVKTSKIKRFLKKAVEVIWEREGRGRTLSDGSSEDGQMKEMRVSESSPESRGTRQTTTEGSEHSQISKRSKQHRKMKKSTLGEQKKKKRKKPSKYLTHFEGEKSQNKEDGLRKQKKNPKSGRKEFKKKKLKSKTHYSDCEESRLQNTETQLKRREESESLKNSQKQHIFSILRAGLSLEELEEQVGSAKREALVKFLKEETFFYQIQALGPWLEELVSIPYNRETQNYQTKGVKRKAKKKASKLLKYLLRNRMDKIRKYLEREDVRVSGVDVQFEIGLGIVKKPGMENSMSVLQKVYEKLRVMDEFREGETEGGDTGDWVEVEKHSLLGLFKANIERFPLEYLAERGQLVEILMESQWRKLLYESAEESRKEKKAEILHCFGIEKEQLDLENFNEVSLAREKGGGLYWLNNEDPENKGFGGKILNMVMGSLKRSESLESVVGLVSEAQMSKHLADFISSKWMAEWFLSYSDPEVRIRALSPMARCMAVPLKFQDQRFFKLHSSVHYDWNFEVKELICDSFGVININLGTKARIGFKSERLLNRCFVTKFDDSGRGLFSEGSIDINLDQHFENERDFTVMNIWGETRDLEVLGQISQLVNLVLVQVSEIDLSGKKYKNLISNIRTELYLEVILVIRESKVNSSEDVVCRKKEKEIAQEVLGGILTNEEVVIMNDSAQEVQGGLSQFERRLVERVVGKITDFREEGEETRLNKDRFGDLLKEMRDPGMENILERAPSELTGWGLDWGESRLGALSNRNHAFDLDATNVLDFSRTSTHWAQSANTLKKNSATWGTGFGSQCGQSKSFASGNPQNKLEYGVSSGALRSKEYIDERNRKIEATDQALEESRDFIAKMNRLVDQRDFNLHELLPFSRYFTEKRGLVEEIRKHQSSNSERTRLSNLETKLHLVESQIIEQEPTVMIEIFLKLVEHPENALILIDLSNRLRRWNHRNVEHLRQEKESLKRELKEREWSERERGFKLREIAQLNNKIRDSSLTLETLFRNLWPYLENNKVWLGETRRAEVKERIVGLMRKGFSLELLNGENLQYKTGFLMEQFRGLGNDAACVVSILGPQSSGKSTLLNFMFGTLFHTSTGRCTSGLYVSLQRFRNSSNHIQWLLIIDTEGLHSPERNDSEYDRKICSFIMTISHIMLVTVKGEMNYKMKRDLEISLYSASQMKSFNRIPRIYFIFNQNQGNSLVDPFLNQIKDMNRETDSEFLTPLNREQKFDVRKEYVWIFGSAFESQNVSPIQMGNGQYGNLKTVSQEFVLKVGKLAGSLLEYVKEQMGGDGFESLGRFFRTAGERWAVIERYPQLTSISDLKTLNNKFMLERESGKWREDFMRKMDERWTQKTGEWQSRLAGMSAVDQLESHVKEWSNEDMTDLQNMWERFRVEQERKRDQFNVEKDLYEQVIREIHKNFNLKTETFRLSIAESVQGRKKEIFQLKGHTYFISKAKELRRDLMIGDPSREKGNEEEIDQLIREQFEADVATFRERQRERLKLGRIALKQLEVIQGMAKDLTAFVPENLRCHNGAEMVTVDWMHRRMMEFMESGVSCFIVDQGALSKLDRDVGRRLDNHRHGYMDLALEIEEKVKINVVQDFKTGFREEVLREEIQEILLGRGKTEECKVGEIESLAAHLKNNGILLKVPQKSVMKLQLKNGPQALLNSIFPHNSNVTMLSGMKMDFNTMKRYFRYETQTVSKEEYNTLSKGGRHSQLCIVHKVGTIGIAVSNGKHPKSEECLQLALDFSDCDNQGRLHWSLCQVVRGYFDFRKVICEIEQICRERVMQNRLEEVDCERDAREIDFQRTSHYAYNLLKNTVNQELSILVQKMEEDMSVCAVQIDSPLHGYLIHIALFFVWKFVGESEKLRILGRLCEVDDKKDQYYSIYQSIVKNGKENQLTQEMGVQIEHFIRLRWREEIWKANGLQEFSNMSLMKILENKYFAEVEKRSFESVYEFVTNPTEILKREEEQMRKNTFQDQTETHIKSMDQRILSEIERTQKVLEKLSEFMIQYEADNLSILNNFSLYRNEGEEISDFSEKHKYLELVSEVAFKMVYGVIQGKEVSNVHEDPQTGLRLVMRFGENHLKHMHKMIKRDPELEGNYAERPEKGKIYPLCGNLETILGNCETKQIFSMRDFFEKSQEVFNNAEDKYEKKTLGSGNNQKQKRFEETMKNVFGCGVCCPFCGQQCESLESGQHKHHTRSSGHRLRLFAGGQVDKRGKRVASLVTCDTIRADKVVEWRGQHMAWGEVCRSSSLAEWEMQIGRSVGDAQIQTQIDNYERVWKHFGKRLCKKLQVGYEKTTVRQFIKDYNENAFDRVESHSVICLDESSSMTDQMFEKAKKGITEFLNHVSSQVNGQDFQISFFTFSSGCRKIFTLRDVRTIEDSEFTTEKSGGGEATEFEPVLKASIDAIEDSLSNIRVQRILFYTLGSGSYPGDQIDRLNSVISNHPEMNFKLFWVSEGNGGNEVFEQSRDELGRDHCQWVKGVKTEHLGNTFVQLFLSGQI